MAIGEETRKGGINRNKEGRGTESDKVAIRRRRTLGGPFINMHS